jgi:D-beta-D-heptose 7-phosphate kinase/D-beta-D-heptose 1-phosphate adenosyltransferase
MNLQAFASARLLVVGDVMIDAYWNGSVNRISPEAPVPVVRIEADEERLGGAGNVALNVASLGARPHLLALAGDDAESWRLESLLKVSAVPSTLLRVPGARTIKKLRVLSRNHQLLRLDFEDAFPGECSNSLLKTYEEHVDAVDAIILSDYAKGSLSFSQKFISVARHAGKPIVVDPKGTDFSRYSGASIITPNLTEFEAEVGHCSSLDDLELKARGLCDRLRLGAVLVTRGADGMSLCVMGQPSLHLPAHAKEVFDVTGAGDTVVAALAVALASRIELSQAVSLANLAASIVVSKIGTSTVTAQELHSAMAKVRPLASRKICDDEGHLLSQVNAARLRGERIVMTNGCFDLLHPGHISYLEKARSLGDRLVIAVNDDQSVFRLKGKGRPVNSLSARMRMLAALECVDLVLPFSEDTPKNLISRVVPDILVKGGDYSERLIEGSDVVKGAGGRVVVLDFLDGFSTTGLIEAIRS